VDFLCKCYALIIEGSITWDKKNHFHSFVYGYEIQSEILCLYQMSVSILEYLREREREREREKK